MSEDNDLLARFQAAISTIEKRLKSAEARPDLEMVKALREQRETDLEEYKALRREVETLKQEASHD